MKTKITEEQFEKIEEEFDEFENIKFFDKFNNIQLHYKYNIELKDCENCQADSLFHCCIEMGDIITGVSNEECNQQQLDDISTRLKKIITFDKKNIVYVTDDIGFIIKFKII